MTINYQFGSDNHSGVHPAIFKAIEKANIGYAVAYGDDDYTKTSIKIFKKHFGNDIEVFLVSNGTAANILGLKAVTESFNSIICAETSHMNVHECCGPEKFIGCKLETIKTSNGKLTIDLIKSKLVGFGDPHMAQPKVISITQTTELGTVYSKNEIKNLSDFAHKNSMLLHVDGARLCNAAAYLKCSLKDITANAGVDILSFGGTKNGMMYGDAVIFFDKKLSKNFEYIRKQGMQLTSKMRFISVQFEEMLSNDLWLKNAKHANSMAEFLSEKIKFLPNFEVTQKVESNAVFVKIPEALNSKILKKYFFHVFDESTNTIRLMCSYKTKKKDITDFINYLKKIEK